MTMMKKRHVLHLAMGVVMTPLLGSCAFDELHEIAGGGNGVLSFEVGVEQLHDSQGWTRASGPQMRPMHSLELTSASGDTIYARSQSLGIINEHSNVGPATRAAAKTTAAFYDSFGVIAFNYANTSSWDGVKSSATPSVHNAKASQDGGKWVVGSNNYWPGASKNVSFFAYAPYSDTNDPKGIELSDNSVTGAPVITYTVPSSAADQSDLLVATALDQDGSGTSSPALSFSHALCGVKFAVGSMEGINKITKIAISGVYNKGTLEIGGSAWTIDNSSANGSYEITMDQDVSTITNQYITSGDDLLFLMPQKVPSGATLTITADGNDYSTSIADESWVMGAMVTYKLSINEITGKIEFSATPSKPTVSKGGENITFTVNSYIEYTNSNSETVKKAIPWTSAIKDINDNTLSYSGDQLSITTADVKIDANTTTSHSEVLKAINYSDENNPHDLSMFDGKQSTANCYVVQGCGWFKLPLVYGNGITKGKTAGQGAAAASNTFGYNQSRSFMNHKGDAIYNLSNAPYINGNGYDPKTAEVVWQSISELIKNPSIEGEYLKFYVNPDKVDQANAVIAVKYGETTVWSWHLWFTASSWTATYTYRSYNFMTMPLGFIDSSDSGTATPRTLPFTFTQDISSGKTTTVLVSQNGDASTGGTCTFYQWGRKDPFPGATADIQQTDNLPSQTNYYSSITNPGKFIKGKSESPYLYNWFSDNLKDLWNVGNTSIGINTATSQKTIYDPSPVGFKVPPPAAFYEGMLVRNGIDDFTKGYRGTVDGDFWRCFGYIWGEDGYYNGVDWDGWYWSCGPDENSHHYNGWGLYFTNYTFPPQVNDRAYGCSVRPVSDQ